MEREILFRGRTEGDGKWIYGDLLRYAGTAQIWEETENGKWNSIVDPETVGQYTGLDDETGRKVFEGDIVRAYGDTYTVFWDGGNCEFGVGNDRGSLGIAHFLSSDMEVIGNVFDDPGLIEGQI